MPMLIELILYHQQQQYIYPTTTYLESAIPVCSKNSLFSEEPSLLISKQRGILLLPQPMFELGQPLVLDAPSSQLASYESS